MKSFVALWIYAVFSDGVAAAAETINKNNK